MKIVTYEGQVLNITEDSLVRYIGKKKTGRGFFRWIIALLIFWPLLLLWFFVGDLVDEVEINGVKYLLTEYNYARLMSLDLLN